MLDSDLHFVFWRFWEKKTTEICLLSWIEHPRLLDTFLLTISSNYRWAEHWLSKPWVFICMMKCHHGTTRLNNLESHDLIAFILIQLYLGNQVFVKALAAVSLLGGCASCQSCGRDGLWVWAGGRGASHDVFCCTKASDIDLIRYFLAQTLSLSAL